LESNAGELVHTGTLEETWLTRDAKLINPDGRQGLAKAFRRIQEKVAKPVSAVYVSLSGEFCVTRIVSGENEAVRQEVREIETRSHLYLSLGHGEKVVAGCVVQQDPKHRHATVSAVHRRTIETILDVAKSVGWNVASIEPTVISLCRYLGSLKLDQDAPVLLVCVGQTGMEIAISFQGRLYLDYCPAGVSELDKMSEILVHHMERLQRYCRRHAGVMSNGIEKTYLFGEPFRTEEIRRQLSDQLPMPVLKLEDSINETSSSHGLTSFSSTYYSSAGIGLLASREFAVPGPNLTERIQAIEEKGLAPQILRVCGPIAAVLLLGAIAWGYLISWDQELHTQSKQLAALDHVRVESLELERDVIQGRKAIQLQRTLAAQVPMAPVAKWIDAISEVMPSEVWLDEVTVNDDGDWTIDGSTLSETEIFRCVESLNALGFVRRASLTKTIERRSRLGRTLGFTIECEMDELANFEGLHNDTI